MLSTRLTLETAASPTPETISVSAMPIVTLSTCSINIGQISAVNRCRLNSGADRATVASIVSNTSYAKFRSTAAVSAPIIRR